jgi:hypothetical protein
MKRSTDPTRGFLNALLDLRLEMSTLNHRIAREMRLNDVDLHCLEVLSRKGPSDDRHSRPARGRRVDCAVRVPER